MAVKLQGWISISKLLYFVGLFFFALSLGWAFGAQSARFEPQLIGAFFGVGLLGLFGGALIQARFNSHRRRMLEGSGNFRPIDLDESFRAYRNYREQPPLFENSYLQTEVFALSAKKTLKIPEGFDVLLIELWEGLELRVSSGTKHYILPVRTLTKLDSCHGHIELDPRPGVSLDYCQGVIHFISSGMPLE